MQRCEEWTSRVAKEGGSSGTKPRLVWLEEEDGANCGFALYGRGGGGLLAMTKDDATCLEEGTVIDHLGHDICELILGVDKNNLSPVVDHHVAKEVLPP